MEGLVAQLASIGSEVQSRKGEITRLENLLNVFEKQVGVENIQVQYKTNQMNNIINQAEGIVTDMKNQLEAMDRKVKRTSTQSDNT